MEEKEFETLLHHLGQDIAYMGLRVQKDVQKSLKNFNETQNSKIFCSKLADILKKFSEFTVQYSQDLENRIKSYNKEDEYREIINKLLEINSKVVINNCDTCKSRDKKIAETSNSLGPPNNNTDDNYTEQKQYDLKNEVLSQYSFHIGGEDKIKPEELTQASVTQFNDFTYVPSEEPPSTPNDLNTSSATIDSNNSNIDVVTQQENKNQLANDNEMYENDHSYTGNGLDIANSAEIDVNEELDVIVISSEKDSPDITTDISSNVPEEKSDEISDVSPPKVIPLPYEPLFKIDQKQGSVTSDKEPIASYALLKQDVATLSNNGKERDLTTINETAGQGNISQWQDQTSDVNNVVSLLTKSSHINEDDSEQNTNTNRSHVVNLRTKSSHRDSTEDDSDVEIISVTSSREDEIIKTQGTDMSDNVDVANSLQESDDSDVEFIDENVNTSKEITVMVVKSPRATERQNSTEDVEIYEKTSENGLMQAGACSATLSGENSSQESTKKSSTIAISPNSEDQNTETIQNYSDCRSVKSQNDVLDQTAVAESQEIGNDAIELSDTDENYTDTEIVPNISSRKSSHLARHTKLEKTVSSLPEGHNCAEELPNLEEKDRFNIDSARQDENSSQRQDQTSTINDSDAEIVSHASPRRHGNVATSQKADQDIVANLTSLNDELPLINSDEITVAGSVRSASSGNYSDTTIVNVTPLAETQGDSNDDSDSTIVTSPVAQAGLNRDENVQNVLIPENSESSTQTVSQDEKQQNSDSNDSLYSKATQKLNVDNNGCQDSDVDFDAPTQFSVSTNAESSETDNTNDVDDQKEAATQDIETISTEAPPEIEDVVTGNCENAELSQESFVFDLEKGDRRMEATIPENMQQNNESAPKNKENGENDMDSQESYTFDLEGDQGSIEAPQLDETNRSTVTVEVSVESAKDKNENIFEDAKGTDADDLCIFESENGSSGDASDVGETSETKSEQKLKEKDRRSLLKIISEYYKKKRNDKAIGTRQEKSKMVSKEWDQPNSPEMEPNSQTVSPYKRKNVKRLRSSDESDFEPAKKISDSQDSTNDLYDIATQEVVKPVKRTSLKRLLSTEEELEDTQKCLDSDEDKIDHPSKKRKVRRLPSTDHSSPDDADFNPKKKLNQEANDLEADEAMSEENNLQVEPTQFQLDDKARDDFLELLDEHANSKKSSENCSSNYENNESDKDEKSGLDEDDENSEKEEATDRIEASQFKLGDSDRDNFLNLLTDKENGERSVDEETDKSDQSIAATNDSESTGESNKDMENLRSERNEDSKGTKSCKPTTHREEDYLNQNDTESDENSDIEQSQFKLNSKERDKFLEMLCNQDEKQDRKSEEEEKDKQVPKNNLKENDEQANKGPELDHVNDEQDIELCEFKLNDKARDDFLDMLSTDQRGDSKIDGIKQESNIENENSQRKVDDSRKKITGNRGVEIKSSQFKLNDEARDEFLDMLTNNLRDNNINEDEGSSTRIKEANLAKGIDDNLKESGNTEMDKNKEEIVNDALEDMVTENSQEIDDDSGKLDDDLANGSDDTPVDDSQIDEKQDDHKAIAIEKSSEFRLDEKERDELLNMLSKHIENKESSSGSDSSESESEREESGKQKRIKKRKKKSKNIDRGLLLELLQEYENAAAGKDSTFVQNLNHDMEYEKMGMDSDENLQDIAKSDISEDSSDSSLLDLIREETVEQEFPKESPRKSRNTNKEAWDAYQQLIKDGEDDISDETGSDISDIDIDDLDVDFSDQERKQKEQKLYAELRKQFNIDEELFINVEQADISEFDLSLLSRTNSKALSKIDRLCDLSNVLQKRKISIKKHQKTKRQRFSASVNSDSDSDNDSLLSTSSNWSDNSRGADGDPASNIESSPLHNLDDNNLEQEKLVNALWETIRNSTDESDGGWSNDESSELSDSEEMRGKKNKNEGSGGSKKGKEKKKQENDCSGEEDDGSEKDSNDESGTESGDKVKKDSDGKKADLDSSDEEDFVGVTKARSAWRLDPLLTGSVTSDETESDSDSGNERRKRNSRIRKKLKTVKSYSDSESSENSNEDKKKMKTPTKKPNWSSDSSDVEFIESFERKKTTPKKTAVIDEQVDEDSPSKIGKGRRNIRALVEDDELAEATKQAKKEETERIKRLQEREKVMESFTQSQSFGSQLSEDETDPLILDVNEEIQIKVHPKITRKLKPHQRNGIQFMWDSCYESVKQLKKGYEGSGCILAHCMGLGKTLQALALIHTVFNYKEITQTKHVLVVCPLSTVSNWRNEYKLAFKHIKQSNKQLYTIEDKKAAGMRFSIVNKWWKNGGILVMGYECFGIMTNKQKLDKWSDQNLCHINEVLRALVNPGPDLVICDEGHLLRNKQTQRNLALNKVETKRRIVLTGTPLQNNLLEYYYMVHFVKPNLLGTEKEYKTNFVNPINNGQFEDSTAVDILFMKKRTHVLHKILAKTVQRVEDTELKQYLPELIDQALFVKLSDLQVKFYNTYLDTANARPVSYTAKGDINRKNFLADIQILRYICTHPDLVTIAKMSGRSKIKEQDVIEDNIDDAIEDKVLVKTDWFKDLIPDDGVKKAELGTKLMIALGIVEEATTNNDKVLIFSQMHAEMDCLEYFLKQKLNFKKGVDYQRMDGTIIPEVRTRMCDQFNKESNTRLRVFIMSTKVGGLGLNLTAANRVILMNVNWNPSYDTQSVFRAFRFGQNKSVYVYRLIAIDTMEEKMYQRQITKLAVAHRVVDKYQITRHYSAGDIQEFYSARPTAEGERPVPNVPEDRILAKLIQKYPFLYRWHEHQALLANRPEEDLNEHQKNAAWEEFNKRNEPPPPGIPLPQQLFNLAGPSGLQIRSAIPGYRPQNPNTPTSGNIAAADHNYSLPKTNPVFPQRTSSIDDFRTTTPSKYIPRPLFVDVKAPLGPRPNLSALNPVPAVQTSRNNVNKAVHSRSDQSTNTTITTTMQTQPHLGKGITITTHSNTSKKEPPLAHSQKPSVSIIPTAVTLAEFQRSSANIVTSTRLTPNITTTKPPPYVPKNANMVQNPLNLSKNALQSAINLSQPSGSGRTQTLKEKAQKQEKNVFKNNVAYSSKPIQITKSLPLRSQDVIPPPEKKSKRVVIPTKSSAGTTTVTTVPPLVQLPNKIVGSRPSTITSTNNEVISPAPLISSTVLSTSTAATPTSDPLAKSTTSATSTLQQSPLQKQMRSFMEHLHQLQSQMKERETNGMPNSGESSLGSMPSMTIGGAATANAPSTANNQVGGPSNLRFSLPPRTVVRVGPKPVIGGVSTTNATGLNAARNLSNITKTYQKRPDKTKGLSTSSSQPTARDTNLPPVSVAGSNALTPISRVILPIKIPPNKVSVRGSSPKVVTVGEVKLNPVNIVKKNGHRVVTNVGPRNGATRVSSASMLIGGNATRIVPVSPGNKKIVVSQKGNPALNAVRTMPARPMDNPLRRKMAANLNKITRAPPKLPSPQRSFNNGTNFKTYQAKKNNPLSRVNSLPSISLVQSLVSKANKENRSKKKLTWKNYNISTSSIDLSNDDNGNTSSGSLPKDMVNTLKKKGVSINYLGKGKGKDVINLD